MNPVLHAGAEAARMGWLMGLTTVVFLTVMVAWTVWAWAPGNRARLAQAASMPLDGGDQ